MQVVSFFLQYWQGQDARKAIQTRLWFALFFLVTLATGVSNAAALGLINHSLADESNQTSTIVWAFFGLCLLMFLTKLMAEFFLVVFSTSFVADLYASLVKRIQATPLQRLEALGIHRLAASLSDDVRSISEALLGAISTCFHIAIFASCLVYLAWLSWQVFLIVAVFLIVCVFGFQYITKYGWHRLDTARTAYGRLLTYFRAVTQGNKEFKLHRQRRQSFVSNHFQPTTEIYRESLVLGHIFYDASRALGQGLYFIIIGLLLFVVAPRFDIGNATITSYAVVLLFMLAPLEEIVNGVIVLSRAGVSVEHVQKLGLSLTSEDAIDTPTDKPLLSSKWQKLELKDVTYTYNLDNEGERFTIGPINLQIEPGQIVFLAGSNGSGKTTLAKILAGLYAPTSGEIYLDGQLITDETRDDYRQLFSAIFLSFFLFDDLLGLDSPDLDDRAKSYLAELQLEHKVEITDGKLSTIDLSQGQRKRLALLTAYLEDRPIYVFDEWTASQDPTFRENFYTEILPDFKRRGKAVLTITHDDKYFHMADRVIKIDFGQLEDEPMLYQNGAVAKALNHNGHGTAGVS